MPKWSQGVAIWGVTDSATGGAYLLVSASKSHYKKRALVPKAGATSLSLTCMRAGTYSLGGVSHDVDVDGMQERYKEVVILSFSA